MLLAEIRKCTLAADTEFDKLTKVASLLHHVKNYTHSTCGQHNTNVCGVWHVVHHHNVKTPCAQTLHLFAQALTKVGAAAASINESKR